MAESPSVTSPSARRLARIIRMSRPFRRLEALTPEFDYVFVVTFGRSGSTLVQGLLNTLPDTIVRGENGFYHWHLYLATRAGALFSKRFKKVRPDDPASAFYGLQHVTREAFVGDAQRLSISMLVGDRAPRSIRRLGFKEVLWHQIEPELTETFFRWFDEVFPGAKYVLNTRDTESALGSGFWRREDRDEAIAKIERVRAIQEHLLQTRPDRSLLVRYEDLTASDTSISDASLISLATFVTGSCDPDTLAQLRATMSVGHGPNPFGRSRSVPAGE